MFLRAMVFGLIGASSLASPASADIDDAEEYVAKLHACTKLPAGSPEQNACVTAAHAFLKKKVDGLGTVTTIGNWKNHKAKDAITDFETTAWLTDGTVVAGSVGGDGASLMTACRNNQTEFYIDWDRYVTTGGIDARQPVTYRIDQKPAVTSNWQISTDFEATFAPRAIGLLRNLKGATSFIVATVPYGATEVRVTFDIAGINQVIEDIAARCGWKP